MSWLEGEGSLSKDIAEHPYSINQLHFKMELGIEWILKNQQKPQPNNIRMEESHKIVQTGETKSMEALWVSYDS